MNSSMTRRSALAGSLAVLTAGTLAGPAAAAPKNKNTSATASGGAAKKGGGKTQVRTLTKPTRLVHPDAAAVDLPITGIGRDRAGNIQLGFGDWTVNTDSGWNTIGQPVVKAPVGLRSFNPATGAQVGTSIRMNNESIARGRFYNGASWWPSIDPSESAGHNGQRGSGVWTNASGDWVLHNGYDGVTGYDLTHVLDVAVAQDGTIYLATGDDYRSISLILEKKPGGKFEVFFSSAPMASDGSVGTRAMGVTISPDQKAVYASIGGSLDKGIWKVDRATRAATQLTDQPETGWMNVYVNPAGKVYGYRDANHPMGNVRAQHVDVSSGVLAEHPSSNSFYIGADDASAVYLVEYGFSKRSAMGYTFSETTDFVNFTPVFKVELPWSGTRAPGVTTLVTEKYVVMADPVPTGTAFAFAR